MIKYKKQKKTTQQETKKREKATDTRDIRKSETDTYKRIRKRKRHQRNKYNIILKIKKNEDKKNEPKHNSDGKTNRDKRIKIGERRETTIFSLGKQVIKNQF